MRIVQTLWTGSQVGNLLDNHGGWASPEYHWMSWALSSALLRRQYDEVELYTDELGKAVLIDELQLPYTKVHLAFDDTFQIPDRLFSLAKIHTFSLQQTPFLHVDGDLFIWKAFPERLLEAAVISSNLEKNLFFNKTILEEVHQHFPYLPEHIKNVHLQGDIFASNAGIIGGKDLTFIREYCQHALEFIEHNRAHISSVNTGNLNFLIEQISLYYLAQSKGVPIAYLMDQPVTHPLYQDYLRFADVPDVEMIHAVGGCKRMPFMLSHLSRRLRLEFPELYYRVLATCKRHRVGIAMPLYDHLQLENLVKGEELSTKEGFVSSLTNPLRPSDQPAFQAKYERSIALAEVLTGHKASNRETLESAVKEHGSCEPLQEVFALENYREQTLQKLHANINAGVIYGDWFGQYAKASTWNRQLNFLEWRISLNPNARVLRLQWKWIMEEQEDDEGLIGFLQKNLSLDGDTFIVTLVPNVQLMSIEETYHEGVDALILHLLDESNGQGLEVSELLKQMTAYFEEDVQPDDNGLQTLCFDAIKRLAFAYTVYID